MLTYTLRRERPHFLKGAQKTLQRGSMRGAGPPARPAPTGRSTTPWVPSTTPPRSLAFAARTPCRGLQPSEAGTTTRRLRKPPSGRACPSPPIQHISVAAAARPQHPDRVILMPPAHRSLVLMPSGPAASTCRATRSGCRHDGPTASHAPLHLAPRHAAKTRCHNRYAMRGRI